MIVRDEGATLLLLTQPDHAQLAGEILGAVRSEPALNGPSRRAILFATREHDNGWIEVDAAPTVEPATGRPRDFTAGSVSLKLELWERGIMRVARRDNRAGALIAEHAVTVHGFRRSDPEWGSFLRPMTTIRDDLLKQIGAFNGPARALFEEEYRCLQLADALSLHFCSGWPGPEPAAGYEAAMNGAVLRISPDPFEGAVVPLRVLGRRVPARRYRDDMDLRSALARMAPEVIMGEARGA